MEMFIRPQKLLMTGATGLLGRNFLFECLHRCRGNLDALDVTVLGADRDGTTIAGRVREILLDDGAEYLSISGVSRQRLEEWARHRMRGVHAMLDRPGLGLGADDVRALADRSYDHVVHVASDTDFRCKPRVVERLRTINVEGTRSLLRLLDRLDFNALTYVGTAYSCGTRGGTIAPDHIDFDQPFRNPYERLKLEAECEVRSYAARTHVPLYVFRPTTLSGRLIHPRLGRLRSFNVFYAYGGLLARFREKLTGTPVPAGRLDIPLRLAILAQRGLNIVPVDYAAKVMLDVMGEGTQGSYHLANDHDTLNAEYIGAINESLKIDGIEFVAEQPQELNPFEQFIYRFLVPIFAPYCNAEPMHFATDNLGGLLTGAGRCPEVRAENLTTLLAYAQSRSYGVPVPVLGEVAS